MARVIDPNAWEDHEPGRMFNEPEVQEVYLRNFAEAVAERRSPSLEAADRILARFSFPSQPVYDEEKIVAWFDSVRERVPYRFGGFQRIWLDDDALAAALVAALRGGELTREEGNRG
jgi:hypothetical protein